MDSERDRREEELRREAARSQTAAFSAERRVRRTGEHRVERLSEDATRRAARRGAREALDEKEQEESGGGGLYGSQIDASHLVGAAIAELVGTFILVFGGIAVAVGFALAVGVLIAGPVTGGAVNPARALGPMLVAGDFTSAWLYTLGPIIGGVVAALLYDRFMAQTEAPN